jgi:hypothetical protein
LSSVHDFEFGSTTDAYQAFQDAMSNIIDGLHIRLNSDSAPVVWRLSDETRALSSYIMFGAAFTIADLVFVREVSFVLSCRSIS